MSNSPRMIFILFLLLNSLYAQTENFNPSSVDSMSTQLSREGKISTTMGELYNLRVTLALPQNTSYQNVSLTFPGEGHITDDNGNQVLYIEHPSRTASYSYKVIAGIQTSVNRVTKISSTHYLNETLRKYTVESKHVKITPEISGLAHNLTAGYRQDIDKIAALAIWVNHYITYDISRIGANRNSLDVYAEPYGVCVEYTNLFTALARSLGYPTRVVMGYAYSPIYGWQLHSWAEVYLGEWVGVDPTWLEVGYIDATHIPMYYSDDTSAELIERAKAVGTDVNGEMQWEGKGALGGGTGDITIQNYTFSSLHYTIKTLPNRLTIGESGAIVITVMSPDYRIFTARYLSCEGEQDVVIFEGNRTDVLLHPGENNIIIPFRVSPLLKPNYKYYCPVSISHSLGSTIVNINVDNMQKPPKTFSAIVSKYYAQNISLQLSTLAENDITIVSSGNTNTLHTTPHHTSEHTVDLGNTFSKQILVYDSNYAQVIALPEQAVYYSNTLYSLKNFSLTTQVPSDRNGSIEAEFAITNGTPYTVLLYIDNQNVLSEESSSSNYTLKYPLPPKEGRHSVSLTVDFGAEKYIYDGSYEVFTPEITVQKVSDDGKNYLFMVSGPCLAYRIFVDNIEVSPSESIPLAEGEHELAIQWIDNAGYERTHKETFTAGGLVNSTNAPVCAGLLLVLAVSVILFFINTTRSSR